MSTVWMVSIGILAVIALLVYSMRRQTPRLDRKVMELSRRLSRIVRRGNRNKETAEKFLKDIYIVITKAVNLKDQAVVYKAVDVLKLALGEKIMRADEAFWLMRITVAALRAKEIDSAAVILEAFRPLIYQMPAENIKAAVEQLALIGVVALRERQPFIAAKVADDLFGILERLDAKSSEVTLLAVLKSLRIVGGLVLRRKETALFREINVRLINWIIAGHSEAVVNEVVLLYAAWLYRIVKTDNLSMYNILLEFIWRMFDADCLKKHNVTLFLTEWGSIAGTAALNPYSPLPGFIIQEMLLLAAKYQKNDILQTAVRKVGYVVRLSITQHGIKTAFGLLYYLLDMGRKTFVAELKFGEHSDGYRKEALLQILQEIIALLTYAAKQDMIYTTGDMIAEIYKYWVDFLKNNDNVFVNEKSVRKFCQLLLMFWLRTKRHPEKNMPAEAAFTQPMLISEKERRQLGFVELR